MLNLSIFAERLKDFMIEKDVDTTALIDIAKVNRTSVNNYLAGNRFPSIDALVRIADKFECTTDYLLGISDNNEKTAFKECPPFNERLQYLFKNSDKTKADLQRKSNIAESAIYYWLNGKHKPQVYDLVKIAEFFECSVDFVLGRGN